MLLLISTVSWSQSKTVTGKVTASEDGSPLPGVNIVEKGTSNGTISSGDGSFTLNVGDNAVLVFSFVGYKPAEVPVGSQSQLSVALNSDVTALSEVVVIGYGEVKKRDATGAVASVKAEDFNIGVIASPEQLIQGKTAGVQITSASGEPGAGVNIRIRGTSSVRNGNNPLFVVDGIPLTTEDVSAGAADIGRGSSAARNPLNFINPNDIESIDILKDASATAIYGSRGANGVVIITTKSGKGKKRQVEYSTSLSVSKIRKKYDLLNRDEFLTNAGRLGADVDALDYGASTDWQDQIDRTSVSHRHDLSFSNAYKAGNYRVSLSYDNQQGIIKNSSLERLTGRVNVNHALLNNKLKLGAQLTFSGVNDVAPPISNNAGFEGDLFGAAYMANPTWPKFADSQFSSSNANPLAMLKYTQDNTGTNRNLINLSAGYDILSSLNFKVNVGIDRSTSTREGAFSPALLLNNGVFGNGRAYIADVDNSSDLLEAFFNYSKTLGSGNLNAVLGYSYQNFDRQGTNYLGWGFANSNMDAMINDLNSSIGIIEGAITQGNYQQFGYSPSSFFITTYEPSVVTLTDKPTVPVKSVTADNFHTVDELQSFFGRVNYSIRDRYIFTGTLRADGSTRFGGNNKYGYFPSAAFAWRLSDETFIPEAFNDLKLRLGYGVTGNQSIPHNLHQRRQRYNGISIENGGNVNVPGTNNISFQNPDLKWEQTRQLNLGLDFAFFSNKLTGAVDYYNKTTTDLLIQVPEAQPSPTPFSWSNLDARVVNRGLEFTLNYYAIEGDKLALNFSFNGAYNENKVEDFNGNIDTGSINGQGLTGAFAQRIQSGQPLYAFFLREFLGFDQNGLSIYNGDFQRFLGKGPIPKYNLGFSVNFRYKNFDVSTFLTGQFGHYVYNNTANAFFTMGSLGNGRNVTRDVVYIGESNINAPDVSTRFLEKGDFIRLQNLNIGYNFAFEGSAFKKLRVYASGQNLFVITKYSGLDPEVNVNKAIDGVPSLGIDYVAYPRARTFTLGLSATF